MPRYDYVALGRRAIVELTTQNLTVPRYPGGHFYLRELHERVVLDVAGDLLASTAIG